MGWLLHHRVPGTRALAFLGGASYAMYLWHRDLMISFGVVGVAARRGRGGGVVGDRRAARPRVGAPGLGGMASQACRGADRASGPRRPRDASRRRTSTDSATPPGSVGPDLRRVPAPRHPRDGRDRWLLLPRHLDRRVRAPPEHRPAVARARGGARAAAGTDRPAPRREMVHRDPRGRVARRPGGSTRGLGPVRRARGRSTARPTTSFARHARRPPRAAARMRGSCSPRSTGPRSTPRSGTPPRRSRARIRMCSDPASCSSTAARSRTAQPGLRPHLFASFADAGYAVADIEYRLAPPPRWQDARADVLCALGWFQSVATTYGVDPARIVVMGDSAGGNLALVAAYTPGQAASGDDPAPSCNVSPAPPAGVIALYPTADLAATWADVRELADETPFPELYVGGSPTEFPDRYEAASVQRLVRAGLPQTLVITGTNDLLVRVERVRDLVAQPARRRVAGRARRGAVRGPRLRRAGQRVRRTARGDVAAGLHGVDSTPRIGRRAGRLSPATRRRAGPAWSRRGTPGWDCSNRDRTGSGGDRPSERPASEFRRPGRPRQSQARRTRRTRW